MPIPGQYTHAEILSQPEVWAKTLSRAQEAGEALAKLWARSGYERMVFTGCGSTYYLSLAAAAHAQKVLGVPCEAFPASELWFNPELATISPGKALMVAVSRSARTSETYYAMQAFRQAGAGEILCLSCYPNEEWTRISRFHLVLPDAQEESLAQTRSFTSLYLAAQKLVAGWAGAGSLTQDLERLPEITAPLMERYSGIARQYGQNPAFDRFYFMGSGHLYGLACELSLKMKEMSLSHSEPFHFMEFRHGPKAMAGEKTLIIGLVSAQYERHERKVLEEMKALGASVLSLGESETEVSFLSGVQELARGVLYLPIGQLLAYEHAISKGLNPDRIHNLKAVVEL